MTMPRIGSPEYLLYMLGLGAIINATSFEELEDVIYNFLDQGKITQGQADKYYYEYGWKLDPQAIDSLRYLEETDPDAYSYLMGYTSAQDLAERLSQLIDAGYFPDVASAGEAYNTLLGLEPSETVSAEELMAKAQMLIRAGVSRLETEAGKEETTAQKEARDLVLERIERATTLDALTNLINQGVTGGLFTNEEGQWLYDQYSPPITKAAGKLQANLNQYIPYLRRFLDEAVKAGSITQADADAILDYESSLIGQGMPFKDLPNYAGVSSWVTANPGAMMTAADQVQAGLEAFSVAGAESYREQEEAGAAERARLQGLGGQSLKDIYLPGLKRYLEDAVKAGTITLEQANAIFTNENNLIDQGANLNELPNYSRIQGLGWIQTPEERQAEEGQKQVDIVNRPRREQEAAQLGLEEMERKQQEAWGIYSQQKARTRQAQEAEIMGKLPSLQSVAEEYLTETGFGEGTKLRSFIESQMPEIAEGISAEREAWWRGQNPLEAAQPDVMTYEGALESARRDLTQRELVLKAGGADYPQLAYATEQVGLSQKRLAELEALGKEGYLAKQPPAEDYYGVGGLRDIALGAFKKTEDPFKKALKGKKFEQDYYRRPGSGLTPRLTPSVRFR